MKQTSALLHSFAQFLLFVSVIFFALTYASPSYAEPIKIDTVLFYVDYPGNPEDWTDATFPVKIYRREKMAPLSTKELVWEGEVKGEGWDIALSDIPDNLYDSTEDGVYYVYHIAVGTPQNIINDVDHAAGLISQNHRQGCYSTLDSDGKTNMNCTTFFQKSASIEVKKVVRVGNANPSAWKLTLVDQSYTVSNGDELYYDQFVPTQGAGYVEVEGYQWKQEGVSGTIFSNLSTHEFFLTESGGADGYLQTGFSCEGTDEAGNAIQVFVDPRGQVRVMPGNRIVCTFTNEELPTAKIDFKVIYHHPAPPQAHTNSDFMVNFIKDAQTAEFAQRVNLSRNQLTGTMAVPAGKQAHFEFVPGSFGSLRYDKPALIDCKNADGKRYAPDSLLLSENESVHCDIHMIHEMEILVLNQLTPEDDTTLFSFEKRYPFSDVNMDIPCEAEENACEMFDLKHNESKILQLSALDWGQDQRRKIAEQAKEGWELEEIFCSRLFTVGGMETGWDRIISGGFSVDLPARTVKIDPIFRAISIDNTTPGDAPEPGENMIYGNNTFGCIFRNKALEDETPVVTTTSETPAVTETTDPDKTLTPPAPFPTENPTIPTRTPMPGTQDGGSGTPPIKLPNTGFPIGKIHKLPAQPAAKLYASTGLSLGIAKLNLDLPIVGVPQVDGEWDTSWLNYSVGYLYGSAYPTWNGNTVLTAHVWESNDYPGPFAGLKALNYGDIIAIKAYGRTYEYTVRENERIRKGDIKKVMKSETMDWLTLVTCEAYNAQTGTYAGRRMVRAVLTKVE